jgi:hypothetical protein
MSLASEGEEIPEQNDNLPQQQDVQGLRRSRSAAKANITKKIKELTEWKMVCENITEAQVKAKEFTDRWRSSMPPIQNVTLRLMTNMISKSIRKSI